MPRPVSGQHLMTSSRKRSTMLCSDSTAALMELCGRTVRSGVLCLAQILFKARLSMHTLNSQCSILTQVLQSARWSVSYAVTLGWRGCPIQACQNRDCLDLLVPQKQQALMCRSQGRTVEGQMSSLMVVGKGYIGLPCPHIMLMWRLKN